VSTESGGDSRPPAVPSALHAPAATHPQRLGTTPASKESHLLENDMSIFRTGRELPASPESVFAAIQDPARLARWWGPDGFTNAFHAFEFRQGGYWQFTMHGPDGKDYPNQSEFLEIVPNLLVRIKHQ